MLDEQLITLGRWVADYYCAPLGEVLRGMTPLAGELKSTKTYTLTDQGRALTRQFVISTAEEDAQTRILRALEARPLSAAHLQKKVPDGARQLNQLERRGLIAREDDAAQRDPLRLASERLLVEAVPGITLDKLKKAERELVSYLELFPGPHNLVAVEAKVKNASPAARALARRGLVQIKIAPPAAPLGAFGPPHLLNAHQQAAFQRIQTALQGQQFAPFLLQGVTGSGKTEVYLSAIEAALALDRGALLLVPEIALTPAVAGQFFARFGDRVAILHSAFHDRERIEQWRRIRSGAARVVVGTRSGAFAPVQNLGLILVDEEHDSSYKQGETPRYHGRDVAMVRAQMAGATIVLGSATPSLESRYNADRGKYTLLLLPQRIERRPMPQVTLIDMRDEYLSTKQQHTFSRDLLGAIGERLEQHEQTMLLHNRRGFSAFVACRSCGDRIHCPNCALTLTFHRRDRRLLCHYCNHAEAVPTLCPKCRSEYLQFLGLGSERVEEELHQEFPDARIARMDRDTVQGKRGFEHILHGFKSGDFDILVGTQMIAKGHDIPSVTLVGVVNADIGLGMPDFRAAERTFQLLTQVAGRAGRGNLPGTVLVQTINPTHYAIECASAHDYERFYARELEFRKQMRYPPFASLANLIVRSESQEHALRLSAEVERFLLPTPPDLKLLGPAEAPVPRLKREFRYQLLIKAASRKVLRDTLHRLLQYTQEQQWPATALVIDVDPLSLM